MDELAPFAIYTIRHSSELNLVVRASQHTIRFTERHRWMTGARLLQDARSREQQVAVVFAAAEEITGVTYWGVLEKVVVSTDQGGKPVTDVVVGQLRRLSRPRRLRDLRLKSTGRPLSEDYIRPYAIVHLPNFLATEKRAKSGRTTRRGGRSRRKPRSLAGDLGVRRTRRPSMADDKTAIRRLLKTAKREYAEFGGWRAFKSGEWLWLLIQKSFRNYWERATAEYFWAKYGSTDPDKVAARLIAVAAKNAAILGAVTGAAVSTDEIVAIVTAGEGGIGLPANLAIAATALSAEAILLVRFQLQLVANLGKIYGVPLDPDDPEDILTILAFAAGGAAADAAGKAGMKIGGKLGGRVAKSVFSKDVLALIKRIAAKIGVKILQRTIVKYTIPVVSIGIGTTWNYVATKNVGRMAIRHFKQRVTI